MSEQFRFLTAEEAAAWQAKVLADRKIPAVIRHGNGHKDRYVFEIARVYKHPRAP
jgi:hypothetical protein